MALENPKKAYCAAMQPNRSIKTKQSVHPAKVHPNLGDQS